MILTQEQYLALHQRVRQLHVKLDILNELDQVIDNITGIAVSGTINLNSESTYRRTGNVSVLLDAKYNLLPSPTSKFWFNRRVGVYIGLFYNDTIQWFNLGKFAISNVKINKTLNSQLIDCELVDYMAFLDGTLGGVLGINTLIPAEGTTISEAVQAATTFLPKRAIEIVEIEGFPANVPIDIELSANNTVYDLLKKLADLYKNYEFYFDDQGYFRFREIKSKLNSPIIWDFDSMDLSLTHNSTLEMKNVKNSIFIWGDINDDTGVQTFWRFRNRWQRQTIIERDNLADKENGDICYVTATGLAYYWDTNTWIEFDGTVDPELNIEHISEKIDVVDDGNIIEVAQAKIRAQFLLLERSNLAQTASFTTVPIYSLEPNKKIKLNHPEVGVEGDYLITQMTLPLGIESSSITCKKIYY